MPGRCAGSGVAADHAATPVAQRGRGEGKASIAGDLATATVVHDTQLPQQQGSRRGDQALSTVDQFSPRRSSAMAVSLTSLPLPC